RWRTERSVAARAVELRVAVVGSVHQVENLETELTRKAFGESPILDHRSIPVPEGVAAEHIAGHVADRAQSRRNHDRAALDEAAPAIKCRRSGLVICGLIQSRRSAHARRGKCRIRYDKTTGVLNVS